MQLYEMTYSWAAWIEAALLLGLLLISILRPHAIVQTVQALSSPIQRRYSESSSHPLFRVLTILFQLGTVALALLTAVAAYMGKSSMVELRQYGEVAGMVVVVVLLKALIDKYILYTFRFPIHESTYTTYRQELWQLMGITLWVYLLVSVHINSTGQWVIPLVIAALYYSILWWKIMQLLGWSVTHTISVLLYMLHMELLPLVVIVMATKQLINLG